MYGKLKRNGFISLICIEDEKYVYLLDLMAIRNEEEPNEPEIINLLNDILADPSIVKVGRNVFL